MCNNAERTVKKKSKIASIDFCGAKIYSKLNCANKVVALVEAIILDNWMKRNCYKSSKTSSSMWLVTFDLENENPKESLNLSKFKRVCQVNITNGYM